MKVPCDSPFLPLPSSRLTLKPQITNNNSVIICCPRLVVRRIHSSFRISMLLCLWVYFSSLRREPYFKNQQNKPESNNRFYIYYLLGISSFFCSLINPYIISCLPIKIPCLRVMKTIQKVTKESKNCQEINSILII